MKKVKAVNCHTILVLKSNASTLMV